MTHLITYGEAAGYSFAQCSRCRGVMWSTCRESAKYALETTPCVGEKLKVECIHCRRNAVMGEHNHLDG